MKLIDSKGQRRYLTSKESEGFLEAAKNPREKFVHFTLPFINTGCRINEALLLTPKLVDLSEKALIFKIRTSSQKIKNLSTK